MSTFNKIKSLHYEVCKRYRELTNRPLTTALLEPACLICRRPQTSTFNLCCDCIDQLPWQTPGCRICQDRLSSFSHDLCSDCQANPPDFNYCRAALSYEGSVTRLINQAKDGHSFPALYSLARIASTAFRTYYNTPAHSPEMLIPVPLHASRLGFRGYNQSLEICKVIHNVSGIPVESEAISRRKGPSQKTLNREKRLANEGKMFTFKTGKKLTRCRHIAIIDDIITTGSTVRELSTLLRQHTDVMRIDVWGIARSNSPSTE